MKRSILVPIALVLTAAACDRGEPGRIPAAEQVSVIVSPTASGAGSRFFPAQVAATGNVQVATRTSGLVRRVTVDVGHPVHRGQLLVEVEGNDVAAGLTAAEAEARLARRYHERIAALEKDGAATPQELDEAEARLATAEARVREARTQLGYVRLLAPMDGVITERHVDPGDLIVPGQPALSIATTGDLKVTAELPAEEAGRVEPGMTLSLVLPPGGIRLPAQVRRVVPALEGRSRTFRVEASVETGGNPTPLLPGMYVRMELTQPGLETCWIPSDAVVRQGQLTGVYVVENDTLRLRWVRLGETRSDAVELLAGLSGDSLLVRDPAPELADGSAARIEVRPWSPAFEQGSGSERKLDVAGTP
jgi:RND family efflux transporter MFP subunit